MGRWVAEKAARLSRQQKGKSVAATSTPARNPDGGRIGDLESTHHAAMMDTVNLSRSQRLLVADATRLAREGNENVAVRDATECARDGQSEAMPVDSRSDLPTALPIRKKRLDIFPRDIQKQVSEAKRMGTLPDLSAILAAQLGLTSGDGPSTAVPRTSEVPPSGAANTGKGRKRKRGSSGVEGSAEEASDVPPSGEHQKKKKKRKKTKRSVDAQSENPEEPTGAEEEEEETQPEEEVSKAEVSREHDDAGEADGSEASLNAALPDGSEEDSGESPLLMRRHNDEVDDEGSSAAFEGETPNRGTNAAEDDAPVLVLSDTSAEGSRRGNEEAVARESSVRASELSALNDRESDRED
ncbi:hypothetical protein IGI04_019340 [Brassica rapa subsp. trilocularis]|uniref:Uncharacterized protein n=1 Tax=Brassica rapa subsp. trilocularis TaxID=1813537 RepID=A0ABQ7MHZ1_BRACM|nr:hypothetical protein IGI04_019340 [Brassica rapa subsp. trilocularis]